MKQEYRKKVHIKAEQYQGTRQQWLEYHIHEPHVPPMVTVDYEILPTREGNMELNKGDWIATGEDGERWVIHDDVFKKSYEPVNSQDNQGVSMSDCPYHHLMLKPKKTPINLIYMRNKKEWRLQILSSGMMTKRVIACPFCGAKLYSDGTTEA